jgi:agmatinase
MAQAINFAALPEKYSALENAEVVIIPVPYDRTSTWLKGADKGPAAIIEASANMELYDIETDSEVYRKGIFTDKPINCDGPPEKMVGEVAAKAAHYIKKGKFTVVIGGEHSVSIGPITAHAEHYKCHKASPSGELTILQLDAHADLRPEYNGSKYNHACVMARAKEIAAIVQVGIRSMDSSEKEFMDVENVFFAEDICKDQRWLTKAISKLTEKVYITIDLDVLDPSIMPSTGTPEPGGLFWYDCLAFLKKVFDKRNVVGFDIAELCPNDNNKAPDFLAAKLIYKLLSYKFRE